MESFQFEGGCIIGWIEDRIKELEALGLKVNMNIAEKYILSEPTASTGIKAKLDPLEEDVLGGDVDLLPE